MIAFVRTREVRGVTRQRPGYAIYHSPLPFIRTLLEMGADPNPSDHDGFPPAVQILLDAGADPDVRTRIDECHTPLEMATKMDRGDLVSVFERMAGRRAAGGGRA